jgi:hypothetical protein
MTLRAPAYALAAILAGCQVPNAELFSQLRVGMGQDEVIRLLGEPSSRHPASINATGAQAIPAYWQYGDNLSTLATGAMFQDQPASDRVWAIYFDGDGRVARWQRPAWDQ